MGISPQDLLKAQEKGLTAADFAAQYGIDGKAFRVHLRAQGIRVGKGKSHNLTEETGTAHLLTFFESNGKKGVTIEDLKGLKEYISKKQA